MAWSVLDLSSITDELVQLLQNEVAIASPAWSSPYGSIQPFHITVNGTMPQAERDQPPACLLSLYLLHVSPDPYYRSAPFGPQNAQVNTSQPLSLNLYYLLTAYANKNYVHEQQAMGLAMRCLHEHAIMRKTIVPTPPLPPMTEEYSITMEVQNADEMSRLWQAIAAPLRLSVVYKVSIVFLRPSADPKPAGPPPKAVELSVEPDGQSGEPTGLLGAAARESFQVPPEATPDDDDTVVARIDEGLALPGDALYVAGTGLDVAKYANVYVSDRDGTNEHMVNLWRDPASTPSVLRLNVPAQVGPADDTHCPEPGLYAVSIGSGPPNKVRSNLAKITIAARVSGLTTPPELPLSGGHYTINGAGFTTNKTEVFFGSQPLTLAGALGPGKFVPTGETSFSFLPPPGTPSGRYYIGIRVNGIDSPPSWYVEL